MAQATLPRHESRPAEHSAAGRRLVALREILDQAPRPAKADGDRNDGTDAVEQGALLPSGLAPFFGDSQSAWRPEAGIEKSRVAGWDDAVRCSYAHGSHCTPSRNLRA